MDYHNETNTLPARELTPWQDLGAGTVQTCSPPPSRARKTIPRAIHEMIGELKVRFQHGSGGDPEGFRARCGLLAEDMADAPPLLLRLAIAHWVREQPFLPTAADLTRLMRDELERRDKAAAPSAQPTGFHSAQSFCDLRNASMAADPNARRDVEWVVVSDEPQLRPKQEQRPATIERVAPDQVDRLNRGLRRFDAPFRYGRDGWPFDLAPGEVDPTQPSTEDAP